MPEKYKDSINLPVAIPAWGLVLLLASAIFTAGTTFQKLDTLIENSKKNETAISDVRNMQFADHAAIGSIQSQQVNHDNRISTLERGGRSVK